MRLKKSLGYLNKNIMITVLLFAYFGNHMKTQGCLHEEIFVATSATFGKICHPGWNRVKVSENLGATPVVLNPGCTGRLCGYIPET